MSPTRKRSGGCWAGRELSLEWADAALTDLEGLDRKTRERILLAAERMAADPSGSDIKKLKSTDDLWRLRVGSWRVRFRFRKATGTIEVIRVLARAKGYGDL